MNYMNLTKAGLLILLLCFFSVTRAEEITRNFKNRDFTSVEAGWGMKVTITQSSSWSVEVKTSERVMEYLKVDQSGGRLRFYIDRKSFSVRDDIYVIISMPELTELSLSGGSMGRIKMDVSSKDFEAELSGGSQLKGELKCADLSLGLSGGSRAELNGKGKDMEISGSGGSIFSLKDFQVKNVDANLSGGSNVTVTMDGRLNTNQSGGSSLRYYGRAEMGSTHFSGGASVSKAD